MAQVNDFDLLTEYAGQGSEAAFAALTERYIRLVYSAALRQVRDPHMAEEVTQVVFVLLARKAHSFRGNVILSAWLLRATRFTSTNFLVSQYRRTRREQEAAQMPDSSSDNSPWEQIAPLLDEAMSRLNEKDRNVVALRFFDQKSLEEIGAALGIETAAAQKRVGRAVEKLRQYFVQHGASIPAASITAALSAHAIHGAPSGLAAVVAASASLKGATASSSTLTLIKSTLKLMAWTKAKIAMVAGVAVLLTAGTATITIERIQNHSSYPWRVRGFDGRVLENAPPLLAILPSKLPSGAWGYMGNKFMGTGVSAQTVVEAAYNSLRRKTLQTVVTTKLPENRYDYIGSLPSGNEERMQAEVKRKFGVVAKLETMETNVLVLTVKNAHAPGLRPGTGPNNMQSDGPGELSCVNQPLSSVAGFLQDYFHIPVVDNTDNTSRFDFDLKWDEKDRNHHNDDALKQALLDRLGLELVPDTQSIPTLVIAKAR